MPTLPYILFAYGLAFGFQNKLPFLRGRFALLDALLKCTYCLGFHTGWMAWIVYLFMEAIPIPSEMVVLFLFRGALVWGFVSAGSCYLIDTAARWLEYRPR